MPANPRSGMLIAATLALLAPLAVQANEADRSVFAFGGRYFTEHMEGILNPAGPLGLSYEDNYVFGGGYQQFHIEAPGAVKFGWEAGAAIRAGDTVSGEIWAGLVGRYDGLEFGDLNVAPSLTLGLSAITDTIGIETERVAPGANPHLLFYIAPEIAVSLGNDAETEAFFRIQHRSGAWGALGDMGDGANAATVGLRWQIE